MSTKPYIAKRVPVRAVRAALAAALLLALVSVGLAAETPAAQVVEKTMQIGGSEVLDFQGITRAAISDPEVADYVVLSARQIMLTARGPGMTELYVWDAKGQHGFRVTVAAPPSRMPEIVKRIQDTIADPAIAVSEHNGVIILEGEVDNAAAARRAEAIAKAYAPNVESLIQVKAVEKPTLDVEAIQRAVGPDIQVSPLADRMLLLEGTATAEEKARVAQIVRGLGTQVSVVDMVSAPAYRPRQVLVHVKVVDVNKSALSDIGVDWGGIDSDGNVHDQPILLGEVRPTPIALDEGGPIRRIEQLSARLNALATKSQARILAEPKLLVVEGETAEILVGGEIPIPVVQSTTGAGNAAAGAVSVEWKEFGVKLSIEADVGQDGKTINLDVTPEVSSLDFGNAIVVSNILLPALRTRRAHSVLHMDDGQTLVIGGLYQEEWSKSVRKVPLLGDIPILGELFKRTDRQRRETELVIMVTPEIVQGTTGD